MEKDIKLAFEKLSDDIYKNLSYVNSGGCGIFANMIKDIFPNAKIYVLVWCTPTLYEDYIFNHLIVKIGNQYYDAKGVVDISKYTVITEKDLYSPEFATCTNLMYEITQQKLVEWLSQEDVWNPMFAENDGGIVRLSNIVDKYFYRFKFPILANLNNDLLDSNTQIPESQENVLDLTK